MTDRSVRKPTDDSRTASDDQATGARETDERRTSDVATPGVGARPGPVTPANASGRDGTRDRRGEDAGDDSVRSGSVKPGE
jgi:hypothetical protein